jgi:integrative and conjugative element protein (TIGR02256 family)
VAEIVVWLPDAALHTVVCEAERRAPAESGGVLLGYWSADREVVVCDVVDGGPGAEHAPDRFVPDPNHQASEVARLYEESGRLHTYLGDWHSHPAGGLSLSRTDVATARRIARSRAARCPRPLMLLTALGDGWDVACWVGERRPLGRFALASTKIRRAT